MIVRKDIKSDVYFMEIIDNKIIINDDYEGLIILNAQLNIVKRIKLIKDMVIYSSYYKQNELLLFCPENTCLIYLDLESFVYKKIDIEDSDDLIFTPLYFWNEDDLILSTYKGEFFRIDIENQHVCKLSDYLGGFYLMYLKLNKYKVIKLFSDIGKVVIETQNKEISILDYNNESDFHDIEIKEENILLLGERRVDLINHNNVQYYYPDEGYICLRGKFMIERRNKYIFILFGNNSDAGVVRIERIEI